MLLGRVLAVLVAVVPSMSAIAQPFSRPMVHVAAEGVCPTRAEVEDALMSWPISVTRDPNRSGWDFWVERDDERMLSRFTLRSSDGNRAFERTISGPDCAAIAGAAAAIVAAHFMEIHLIGEPAPALMETASPPAPWILFASALGNGLLYIQPTIASWSGEATIGIGRRAWELSVTAGFSAPTTQETTHEGNVDRIGRSEYSLRLDFSRRFGGATFWLQPGIGALMLLSRVTALDLSGRPSVVRSDFGPNAVLVSGVRLSDALFLLASMSGAFLLRQDIYTISPGGPVAYSPKARLSVGIGLRYERKL